MTPGAAHEHTARLASCAISQVGAGAEIAHKRWAVYLGATRANGGVGGVAAARRYVSAMRGDLGMCAYRGRFPMRLTTLYAPA